MSQHWQAISLPLSFQGPEGPLPCQIAKRESEWAILAPGQIATIVLVAVGSYGDTFILQSIWEGQAP